MPVEGEDLDAIFNVLSHRIRRSIIESIAEKGPRSFTQLMEDAGVEDTGTLTFHLRKMAGFIRKNERGDYELTELGLKAYSVLKTLKSGGHEVKLETVAAREPREVERGDVEPPVVVISDRIKFTIDRSLLEQVKARGKKLVVTDVITLNIAEDVDPRLFDEVVESISDVVTVRAPEKLRSLVELKSRDVLSIRSGGVDIPLLPRLDFIGDIVESVTSSLASIFGSLAGVESMEEAEAPVFQESFSGIRGLRLELSGGSSRIRSTSGEASVSIYRKGVSRCTHSVDVREGVLDVRASGCSVEVEVPGGELDILDLGISGGYVNVELTGNVKKMEGTLSGGSIKIEVNGMSRSAVDLSVSGGSVELNLSYTGFEGLSEARITLTGGLLESKIVVPENVKVSYIVDRIGGVAKVYLDEKLKKKTEARGELRYNLEVVGGLAKIEFKSA